jgi:hypothetical protein
MKLILKMKGTDTAQRSFEQLTTTENVSYAFEFIERSPEWILQD